MCRRNRRTLSLTAILLAVVFAGFAIAEAVAGRNAGSLVQIAWLPAVVVASASTRSAGGRSCRWFRRDRAD